MKPWRSTLVTNGIIFGSGLVGGVLAARWLGAEDRGILAAVLYWPHFLAGIGAMGINEGLVIQIARKGDDARTIPTVAALSVAIAMFMAGLVYLLLPLLLGESRQQYLFFTRYYSLLFLPCSFLAINLLAIEQGKLNFQSFNQQRVVQALAYPVLLAVFWLLGLLTIETAAIAVVTGTAVIACWRLWRVRAFFLLVWPSIVAAGQLLRASFRLHLVNIVMSLSMQLDKMMLVLFSGNVQLGYYVVAATAAAAVPSLFVQTFINIMLPTAARAMPGQDRVAAVLVPLRRLCWLMIFVALMLLAVLPFLIRLVYGEEFGSAGGFSQILVLAFACNGIKMAFIYLLRSWQAHRAALYGESLASLMLAGGSYWAISWGDVTGLCLLFFLAQLAAMLVVAASFCRLSGMTWWNLLWRPVAGI